MNMKSILLMILIIAASQAAERTVLFEDHTNAQCGPCWNIEGQINTFVNAHLAAGDLAVLRTHAWWPGTDPIYNANPTEQAARINFYNISGVPALKMGGILPTSGTNLEGRFDIRAATPCYLDIEVTKSGTATDETGTIYIALTAEQELSTDPMKLHAIFVEDNIPGTGYWSSSVFEQAFRDNLCGADGVDVEFGTTYPSTIYFEFPYSTENWDDEQVHLTVFVQSVASYKNIHNASYSALLDIPENTGIEGAISPNPAISISANPNSGSFTVTHKDISSPSASISLYNILGRQLDTRIVSGEQTSFSVDNSGIYLVVMNTAEGNIVTERVVVTK